MNNITLGQVGSSAFGAMMLVAGIAGLRGDLEVLVTSLPSFAPWLVLLVGLTIIVGANFQFVRNIGGSFVQRWHINPVFESAWPVSRTISLHEAAQRARDATVGTTMGKASEILDWDGDPISYCATALGMVDPHMTAKFAGPLQLYGKRFASGRRVLIPMEDRRAANIADRGRCLTRQGEKKPLYTDLEILRSEMHERIRHMKSFQIE